MMAGSRPVGRAEVPPVVDEPAVLDLSRRAVGRRAPPPVAATGNGGRWRRPPGRRDLLALVGAHPGDVGDAGARRRPR